MNNLENVGNEPFALFEKWYKDAQETEINDPNAMCLATAGQDGMPDARMVLLKDYDERGFVFYTNETSRKGQQILQTRKAAILFHWKSSRRQIRVCGNTEDVSETESDAYFASRHPVSRLGAIASDQSSPLDSRERLVSAVQTLETEYKGREDAIPRPAYWRGFRIIPQRIEFWQEGEYRLHDRFEWTKDQNGAWIAQRLYP